jgi:ketosteroid isomerase-like protein
VADEDFEVVRRAWAATSRTDLEGFKRELAPEIVAIPFGAAMEGKSYRGPEAVIAWLRDEILATWEYFEVLPERFERVGDKLLVTGRWHARGAESGVELDIPATWVIEVRDGKIA